MSESQVMNCIKVTLSTKKVVILKEMKMKYQNLALQAIGNKAKDNQMLAGSLLIQELAKILIVKIDDKKPTGNELENLDELFTFPEFTQVSKAIGKIAGLEEDLGELPTEFVTIGGS